MLQVTYRHVYREEQRIRMFQTFCNTKMASSRVRMKDETVLQCVAVRGSVLQCAAVCCSVLQCAAVCWNVLQCAAVCCSVQYKYGIESNVYERDAVAL